MRNGLTHRNTWIQAGGEGVPHRRPLPPQPAPRSSLLAQITGQGRQPRPAPSETASSSSSLAGSWSRRRDTLGGASQPSRREAVPPERNYTSQKASRWGGCPSTGRFPEGPRSRPFACWEL